MSDYNDWLGNNLDNLKEEYVEYVTRDVDRLYDAVFWWDWTEEQVLRFRKKAEVKFEQWCQARFEEE